MGIFALCFRQQPGRQVFDTQLVLPTDPLRFLARGLHLWDDETGFGELSDQAYGYLFPMGPFFVLCHALALPAWVAQRAWVGLLLVAGYSGTVRLARVLGIGTPAGRIIGGAAYALSPLVLAEVGSISAEAMGQLLAPWALIPLVRAFAPDGPSPRRAAARSGVAILMMGGVNAFVTLAALPLPALWLLTRAPGRLKRRVAAWWCVAVGAATLWWAVPLLVFGKYSPRFIDYIESAANTTMPTAAFEALRGTTGWLPYVPAFGGDSWNRAGVALSTYPLLIAVTAGLAAVGLAGLAHRGLPHRGFLLVVLLTGLALVTFGHVGALTPPWAPAARTLLDGPLAPFRNIHRFDAAYRIALVLGAVHAVGAVPRAVVTGAGRAVRDLTRWPVRRLAHAGLALLVVAAAFPVLRGQLASGSFSALPDWWKQAAGYLSANAAGQQALLLPAAGFGDYSWGRTIDEPFATLADTPWAARIQAPYVPVGDILMMDAVERTLADGRAAPELADYLARAGVGYLVVRNDLDWRAERTLRPSVVHATLDASPGLHRVAAFGPPSGGAPPEAGPAYDTGLEPTYPALELYEVDRPVVQAAAYPQAGALRVAGGPESVLALLRAGLLADGTATLPAADAATPTGGTRPVVTDGLRRQEVDFGKPDDHSSATLTAGDPWRLRRAANGYDPYPGSGDLTVAAYLGAKDIQASSSGSDVTAGFLKGPDHLPYAAFDGNGFTFWDSANTGSPVGQWLRIDLEQPVSAPAITVQLLNGPLMGGSVRSVEVRTDAGAVTTTVNPTSVVQKLAMPPGPARWIKISVAEADGPGLFAVADVAIPGVQVQRTLVVPSAGSGALDAVYAFTRSDATTGCVDVGGKPVCSPWLGRFGEEPGLLDRTFTVTGSGERLNVTGTILAWGGPALDAMLQGTGKVTVTASSRLTFDPRLNPVQTIRPDAAGPWIAGALDPQPSLTLSWPGKRRLTELDVTDAPPTEASVPRSVHLESPAGSRDVVIPDNGVVTFPALTTDRVTVSFPSVRGVSAAAPGQLGPATLPVGVSGLRFPALDDLVGRTDPDSVLKTVCGEGPSILVDDRAPIATRVVGTVADALADRPLTLEPCDPAAAATGTAKPVPPLDLAAGSHRIRLIDGAAFTAATADLVPDDLWNSRGAAVAPTAARPTRVLAWGPQKKTVRIGAGDTALLVLRENANPGWQATLDGRRLAPVTVDGWQAGWVVPAGAGGDVRLVYAPDTPYRAGLLLGGGAALGLVAAAVLPRRRRFRKRARSLPYGDEDSGFDGAADADVDALPKLDTPTEALTHDGDQAADAAAGEVSPEPEYRPSAADAAAPTNPATSLYRQRGVAAVVLLAFVAMSGPWALLALAAAASIRRVPRWAPAAAVLASAAAGLIAAVRVQLGTGTIAVADSPLIQGLCLVALGFTVSALLPAPRRKRRPGNG